MNLNNDVTPNPILTASMFMNIASTGAGFLGPPVRVRRDPRDNAEKAAKRAERKKERDRKRDARRRARR